MDEHTPEGGTRHGSFVASAAIPSDADIQIKLFAENGNAASTTLVASKYVSPNSSQIGYYSYSVAGLALGSVIREEITSVSSAFSPITRMVRIGLNATALSTVVKCEPATTSCVC